MYDNIFEHSVGGVAHLGERLNGIQEVRGSIPLISTRKNPYTIVCGFFLFIYIDKRIILCYSMYRVSRHWDFSIINEVKI